MDMEPVRILVVDDELRYLRIIKLNLEASGYEVLLARNGQQALDLFMHKMPDLILLDLMMPGLDGYAVCRQVREFSNIPIIMLTALDDTTNKVKGLDLGADDYITKPFSARELLARVRARLRRSTGNDEKTEKVFCSQGIKVNFVQQRVYVQECEVALTHTEYHVLCELVRHAGRILVPEYLLEAVWGIGHEGENQLVWQAIHRLRKKIEPDPHNPIYIHTRPGLGYVFLNDKNHSKS